jgi:membrane-associated phospholipid phosphatase
VKNCIISLLILLFTGKEYCTAQERKIDLSVPAEGLYCGISSTQSMSQKNLWLEANLTLDSPQYKINISDTAYIPPERFKTRIPQALVVPGILIAYGLTTIRNHGLYSSYQARKDLLSLTGGKGSNIDNVLIISPYIEFGALLLFKIQCRNDFVNTSLLIVKSELLMLALTYPLKLIAHQERPYSYQMGLDGVPLETRKKDSHAFQSMPSGHTAEAFVAATIVYREYRYLSPWYGIGAYTLATSVAAFRMINDQHWESDVFVGAGIGMLSANVVYATHQHRWGRNEICLFPIINGENKGLSFSCRF